MSDVTRWRYYNHALLPDVAPHEEVVFESGHFEPKLWNSVQDGVPLIARWTSDFDCGVDTGWWYVIKDSPVDLNSMKAKRRNQIRKAIRETVVEQVDMWAHAEELYTIYGAAFNRYSVYDNRMSRDAFLASCAPDVSEGKTCWMARSAKDGVGIGFMTVIEHECYAELSSAKYHPEYSSLRPSDAIHWSVLKHYLNTLQLDYVSSGSRSINHDTNSQVYKFESWGFRKAYARLHVKYRAGVGLAVRAAYPFRKAIAGLPQSSNSVRHLSAILIMEESVRKGNRAFRASDMAVLHG